MAIEKIKMSQAQYDKIKADLDYMETVRTREVAEQLKEARGFGDLSENSEQDEAKSEQGKLYSKIAELHNLLENAEIVEAESVAYSVCQYFHIETAENSFGYIAGWSQGKELKELRASLETINRTSSELISSIEKHFQEVCKEKEGQNSAFTVPFSKL